MSHSDPAPDHPSLKALLIKGLAGTIALVGTTAIPIIVQRSLDARLVSPSSVDATVPVAPAQVAPLPEVSPVAPAATVDQDDVDEDDSEHESDRKGKKKREND